METSSDRPVSEEKAEYVRKVRYLDNVISLLRSMRHHDADLISVVTYKPAPFPEYFVMYRARKEIGFEELT